MTAKMPGTTEIDTELDARSRKVCEKLSDSLHILSNEPSLALYRLQEHVRKSMPPLVEKKIEATNMQNRLQGACFDIDNAISAVSVMTTSVPVFQHIHEMLRSCMFLKQQLDYETSRRENRRLQGLRHTESSDSLAQEVRKSKSLGHLRSVEGSRSDLASDFGGTTSTRSTPISGMSGPNTPSKEPSEDQLWMFCAAAGRSFGGLGSLSPPGSGMAGDEPNEGVKTDPDELNSERSSTPTSGADSHVSEDAVDRTLSEFPGKTSPEDISTSASLPPS